MPPLPTGDDARRVCLLTGAGGTLGNAFCQLYGSEYDIVAVCRTRAPGVASQNEWFVDPLDPSAQVDANATRVYTVHADLDDARDVERVLDIVDARYGRVDLLVNAAADMRRYPNTMVDGEGAIDVLTHQLNTNVVAPFRLSVRLAERLWISRARENRAANRNVVNVSSIAGIQTYRFNGQAGYAASKAALNALSRHMSAEFGQFGVRVNVIAPNSFPQSVPTERVVDAVVALDRGSATGTTVTHGIDGG